MTNKSDNHKEWSRALLNVAYADLLEKSRKVEKELSECKDFVNQVARHDFELSEMCCYMVVEAAQKVLKDIRK